MKKVVSIHLAGKIFQIEEDGFFKLDQALGRVRLQNPSNCETLEAYFADQFQNRIELGQKVITFQMVYELLRDKGLLNENFNEPSYSTPLKKVYRSNNNAVIGGVCSGLGHFLGIDPVIIRLLFAVMFFGFGFGIILYIIMWVIIPLDKTGYNI